jgi:integrase/recombinase XerD
MFKTFSTRQEAAELLRQWDIATTRRFREGWKDDALTVTKKLERLRALFRFAQENEWINGNPAAKLKNPVAKRRPTLPFSPEEMIEILNACDEYRGERNKMRAFVLPMRYSGLRVGDAARLARDGIADGKLFLYTAKTGTPVWVPLPPATLDALASFQPANKTYFSGLANRARILCRNSGCVSCSSFLTEPKFKTLTRTVSGIRSRSKCSLSGVPIERVSVLVGHTSIRVTERHYAPWVKAGQEQLESDVMRSWEGDRLAKGTPEVHEKTKVVKFPVSR